MALGSDAKDIPVERRAAWLQGENYEQHHDDMEADLHKLSGTPYDEATEEFLGPVQRVITVSNKPFRGTRKRIVSEVAAQHGLPEKTVDNFWKQYRRESNRRG